MKERQARQDDRQRNKSATLIQSHYRKHRTRRRLHDQLRAEFGMLLQNYNKNPADQSLDKFSRLFQLISIFFS